MALGKKAYPKATVKKIIKAHSDRNIKKNADVTVRSFQPQTRLCPGRRAADSSQIFLNYVLFMETYASFQPCFI